jgi:hypothetical protein
MKAMAWRNVAEKKYRLRDGTMGTEYEYLAEVIRRLQAEQRALEERIELAQIKLRTAEGHP